MIEDVFTLIFLSVIKVKSFSFRIHGMLLPLLNDGWYIVLHTLTFFIRDTISLNEALLRRAEEFLF